MDDSVQRYVAPNIWFEHADRIFAINFKKGTLVPVGTPVTGVRLFGGSKARLDFQLSGGLRCSLHLQPKFAPGVTAEAFANRTLSEQPREQLIAGLSDHERECVERGVVTKGMSRRAVLLSFGYPPEHFTPSLEADRWYYWLNRFMKKELVFGADGLTMNDL